jgi:hypothetical protein
MLQKGKHTEAKEVKLEGHSSACMIVDDKVALWLEAFNGRFCNWPV